MHYRGNRKGKTQKADGETILKEGGRASIIRNKSRYSINGENGIYAILPTFMF
jgi:hypothetical protein